MNTKLPTNIRHNRYKQTDNLFTINIQDIKGFNKSSFTFATDSLDDALFYRNFVLDLIGRRRPDDLEPSASYRAPAEPRLWAPIPVKLED